MTDMRDVHRIWRVFAFMAVYVVLDLFTGPYAAFLPNGQVWHPAAGLALVFLLLEGNKALLPLLLTIVLAQWLAPFPVENTVNTLLPGLMPVLAYVATAHALRRGLPDGGFFADHRSLLRLTGVIVAGALFGTLLHTGALVAISGNTQILSVDVLIRYWMAESAGMLIGMPLFYLLCREDSRADFVQAVCKRETLGCALAISVILAGAWLRPDDRILTFYLLFLPLAWAAARQGMAGVIVAAVVLEAGVTTAILLAGWPGPQMPDVQVLLLTLTLAGFLTGVAVDRSRRASAELRQSLRLAAAGEMAGALAHELNQPLTALSAYGSACARLIESNGDDALLRKTVGAMVAESRRASDVLKRLREFFRSGSTALEPLPVARLIAAATAPFVERARLRGVEFVVAPAPEACLLGDRVQLEIVVRNLLSNAFEEVEQASIASPRVVVESGAGDGWAWIRVRDSGSGIPNKIRARLFEPFVSMKASGMGLGLAISRVIIETHGGTLTVEAGTHGILKIRLPLDAGDVEASDDPH